MNDDEPTKKISYSDHEMPDDTCGQCGAVDTPLDVWHISRSDHRRLVTQLPEQIASEAISEKSSAWTDAQRDAGRNSDSAITDLPPNPVGPELTGAELEPGRELTPEERQRLPVWAEQLRPGRGVEIDGWNTRIVLIDPERSMVLLFVEGPSKAAVKRVERIIKQTSKKGSNKTPKGGSRKPRHARSN